MTDETTDNGGGLGYREGLPGRGSGDRVRLQADLLVEARPHGMDVVSSSPHQVAQQLSAAIDDHRAAKAKAALERSLAHVEQLARAAAAMPKPQPDPEREARAQEVRNVIMNKVASLGWARTAGGRT